MRVDPFKTGLHRGNAYWMAILSDLVYEDYKENKEKENKDCKEKENEDYKEKEDEDYKEKEDEDYKERQENILKKLRDMDGCKDFQHVKIFSRNGSDGIFVMHKDYLAMVFRGTDGMCDMWNNFRILQTETSIGDFHVGFWDALQDIWGEIYPFYLQACGGTCDKVIKDMELNGGKLDMSCIKLSCPLFITGHSLGGAVATIAAVQLLEECYDITPISVYTFGQPMAMGEVSAKKFESYIGNIFFRFQNNNDMVSRLPLWICGYRHVGERIYISADGVIRRGTNFGFRFLDAIRGLGSVLLAIIKKEFIISDVTADHKIKNYINAIRDAKVFPND